MSALLKLEDFYKIYRSEPDFAEKIANVFGSKYAATEVRAVNGVNLEVRPGEVLGLVW
nr:hypothetical protein [Pseudovibrio flavus]